MGELNWEKRENWENGENEREEKRREWRSVEEKGRKRKMLPVFKGTDNQ